MADDQTPAATPHSSAPAAESDDSIIADLLKGDAEKPGRDSDGGDDADGPEEETDADEDHAADDTADADDDDTVEADDEAEPDDADDPDAATASLAAARKAAAEGDIEKAFKLAFGQHADKMLSANKLFTAVRAAKAKAVRDVQAKETQVVQREQQGQQWVAQQRQQISGIIEQLRPYEAIYQAQVAFKQSGDPELLKAIIEKTADMPYDEAQKIILTKSRRSPGERALAQQVQTLMQKLEEKERKAAEETQQLTQQQQYQADIGIITSSLKGEVTKVPRFADRVYQVLMKTRTPTGLSMTVEEAGRRVLHAERRKLAKHPLLPKVATKNPVSQAASTLAKARKKGAPPPALRRDSRGNGAPDEGSESTDDIINDLLKSNNRRRAQ